MGSDETFASDVTEDQVSELHPETDVANDKSSDGISKSIHHVEQELSAAEQFREHEALATDEGMPSGELDEDPPPPNAKSTSAD